MALLRFITKPRTNFLDAFFTGIGLGLIFSVGLWWGVAFMVAGAIISTILEMVAGY